ncbi:MAG TPA: glycosyltransferase N-terminal domain-containing protein [Chitinophagaceae bacterium]
MKIYPLGIRIASIWNEKASLWIKGRKNIFERIKITFNTQHSILNSQVVWMHCASLGEFEQGRPLIEKIRKEYPLYKIVISFFSPSGYEIEKYFKGGDHIFYLPADSAPNAKKFIELINPKIVLWVKYEYWYYYLSELKKRNIPTLLISGYFREDQPFFKWYGNLWREMLQCFTHYFLQNEDSKILLETLNIKNVTVSGDTRFDRVITIAENFKDVPLIKEFCGNNKVIVAGSTWEDDEAELVHYAKTNAHIKFIIAPHEVDKENIRDVKKKFVNSVLYSEWVLNVKRETADVKSEVLSHVSPLTFHGNCLIIDSIGILSRIYNYADITYVGGGFGYTGLHNILEAAVYGKPVIFGPEIEKNIEAQELIDRDAGIIIKNALELEKVLNELLYNEPELKRRSDAAKNYVYSNAGATKKIMEYIQEKRLLTN